MPLEPTPEVLSLLPDGDGAEELMLVQVTRFKCGSIAVDHTMHHAVADGRAACNFLLAWGQATRGAAFDPVPAHDRASLFLPRQPLRVAFEHRGVEFMPREEKKPRRDGGDDDDEVVVQRVRFNREFVAELRSQASAGAPRPYSTLHCVAAHLWRCITKARGLDGGEVTRLCVAVDGRMHMRDPPVPEGYTGNVVLWARPSTTAGELVSMPLRRAVELISREVARVDDGYFRSFIDFANSDAVEEERLVPTADLSETVLSPDVEVDSLLHAPFYDLDFGGGPPFFFMPSYLPVEGSVFIFLSFSGDRSVDAYAPLFRRAMETFNKCCYSLAMADARL
ncbi:agmatine coumaroyltransferase-2-like [Panicum virgatum]|nr:agmatine coumaroyltransferase-2-like [Panicum virgatum]